MCGRFALHATAQEIASYFRSSGGFVMEPRYNIAPTQTIPVILHPNTIEFCRWGFIAPWTKTLQEELPVGHINARVETLLEKPTFKESIQKRRCLIPASGYFEWRKFGEKKQPYYVYFKNKPLIAFAGIWSYLQTKLGPIRTCAIITQNANSELSALHERMPLIIPEEFFKNWLAVDYDFSDLAETLLQVKHENIGIKPVTPSMNHPRFDGIECIRALV